MSDSTLPWSAYAAEFVGTFFFQFLTTAIALETKDGLVASALAIGLTQLVISAACIGISGAHLNPAVTLGVVINGKCGFSILNAFIFMGSQFFASIFASFLTKYLLPRCLMDPTTGLIPDDSACPPDQTAKFVIEGSLSADHFLSVLLFELVCTFALVWAYFATAIDERSGRRGFAPMATGFAMIAGVMAEAPGTGGSMSPARTLAAAIVYADLSHCLAPVFVWPGILFGRHDASRCLLCGPVAPGG
jgi:glycerol uptake facilitator-like aquaporin